MLDRVLDFKNYYKAKTVQYWHEDRHTDEWKRTESKILNPHYVIN